jgi:hypothetical protein
MDGTFKYQLGTQVFVIRGERLVVPGKIVLREILETLKGKSVSRKVSYGIGFDDTNTYGESAEWFEEEDLGHTIRDCFGFKGAYWTMEAALDSIEKIMRS